MRQIREKLNSRRGASLFYALMLLMVASVVSATVLGSAVTAAKLLHDDRTREQDYLALSSAARLVKKLVGTEGAVTVVETYVTDQKTGVEEMTECRYETNGALGKWLNTAVQAVRGGISEAQSPTIYLHASTADGIFPRDAVLTFRMNQYLEGAEKFPIRGEITLGDDGPKIYFSGCVEVPGERERPLPPIPPASEDEEEKLVREKSTLLAWTVTLSTNPL